MSQFTHSIVLFSGDDGLPLMFNIQYATDKDILKPMIEFGGGFCTRSDDAIYLVSPGTKVLNVDPSKKLVSSKYIYDCVKQNYLLETDEYRFEINEMETSDISDNSLNLVGDQDGRKSSDDIIYNSVDLVDPNKTVSPNFLTCPNSNHDFDFEDSDNRSNIFNKEEAAECNNGAVPLQFPKTDSSVKEKTDSSVKEKTDSSAKEKTDASVKETTDSSEKEKTDTSVKEKTDTSVKEKKTSDTCVNAIPDSLDDIHTAVNEGNLVADKVCGMEVNEYMSYDCNKAVINNGRNSPVSAVIVSSSQPNKDVLDDFDNMILNKVQENPVEKDDECLSQSYTVSSSADAQVSPKASSHNISAEIFDGSPDAPDSASQTSERQQYIKNLEKEIEQILKKPSPKSIQDKIVLVKYICCVKKLAPAIVLQTLQNF